MLNQAETFHLSNMLERACSGEEFFAHAKSIAPYSADEHVIDDFDLALNIYNSLCFHIKDQTLFSIRAGTLMTLYIGYVKDKDLLYDRAISKYNIENIGSYDLSELYFISIVCGKFDAFFSCLEKIVKKDGDDGRISMNTIAVIRSLITSANMLYNPFQSLFLPDPVKAHIRDTFPNERYKRIVEEVDGLAKLGLGVKSHAGQIALQSKKELILFALEDFVFDKLNTLTKLYCDYFFIINKYTSAKVSVRVFNIYQNFSSARFPSVWDPPRGSLSDLMSFYFGEEGAEIAKKIDFQYVDCWASSSDYINAVESEIFAIAPSVTVTCLDKHSSFLERILYRIAPLLQFEVINNSGFVRSCDVLVPNGAVTSQREADFNCYKAPIPQIPFLVQAVINKHNLGLADDTFLVAVIGKQFPTRMLQEGNLNLSYRFCHAIGDMLELHNKMKVAFIGESAERIHAWISESGTKIDKNKIIVEEFVQDLRAYIQVCDLIVNPPIHGGGRSIGLAITDKMPVLIFNNADAGNFVPKSNICENISDFVIKTQHYVEKGCGYRESYLSESGVAPFSDEYNQMAAVEFVSACALASDLGRKRLSA